MEKTKKKFTLPHLYLIITCLIFVAGILTYIIPAGTYDFITVEGRNVVDPASFHYLEDQTPAGLWDCVMAIPKGMVKQSNIIMMVFLIGGAIGIVNETKCLDSFIGTIAKSLSSKLIICVPLSMLLFSVLGQLGLPTPGVAFVPLGLLLAQSLGGDALVALAIVTVTINCGFATAVFSGSNTLVAQAITGLPLYSGMVYRLICCAVFVVVNSWFVIRYIKKIRMDPTKSFVYGEKTNISTGDASAVPELTKERRIACVIFAIGMCILVYGGVNGMDSYTDIPMIFVITGFVCGLICKMTPNQIARAFIKGMESMVFGGLICGFSAGISIVLSEGNIIYTIVHALCSMVEGFPLAISANMMFVANLLINVFIVSGSGQAAAVMPIFSPVADVIGMTQQTAVLAYSLGDGLCNMLLPHSTTFMAAIALAGVGYNKWVKFAWKMFLVEMVASFGMVTLAVLMNWGPF